MVHSASGLAPACDTQVQLSMLHSSAELKAGLHGSSRYELPHCDRSAGPPQATRKEAQSCACSAAFLAQQPSLAVASAHALAGYSSKQRKPHHTSSITPMTALNRASLGQARVLCVCVTPTRVTLGCSTHHQVRMVSRCYKSCLWV